MKRVATCSKSRRKKCVDYILFSTYFMEGELSELLIKMWPCFSCSPRGPSVSFETPTAASIANRRFHIPLCLFRLNLVIPHNCPQQPSTAISLYFPSPLPNPTEFSYPLAPTTSKWSSSAVPQFRPSKRYSILSASGLFP